MYMACQASWRPYETEMERAKISSLMNSNEFDKYLMNIVVEEKVEKFYGDEPKKEKPKTMNTEWLKLRGKYQAEVKKTWIERVLISLHDELFPGSPSVGLEEGELTAAKEQISHDKKHSQNVAPMDGFFEIDRRVTSPL